MQPDASRLLIAIQTGDRQTTGQLLPQVYDELRQLAAARLNQERAGRTLQPTALVHEALLQFMDEEQGWDHPGHFFAAVAKAMRRILIDRARRKASVKHGGLKKREPLDEVDLADPEASGIDVLDLDGALERLAQTDAAGADLVKLRFYAGLSMDQAAEALQISPRSAYYLWTNARTFLRAELDSES